MQGEHVLERVALGQYRAIAERQHPGRHRRTPRVVAAAAGAGADLRIRPGTDVGTARAARRGLSPTRQEHL
ncbi:hypothetical protein GCM10010462_10160 [Microbacterium dextranolyticum]|uniref:Uncharacterized protein n=1 Tax=Microbacterium dextranolyticum TaxID=36806 RepID=A0A9W6M4Z7_9MICO|nr:hypothetical protein GCM10017591_03080 [Microbacterium dextranolyticum]